MAFSFKPRRKPFKKLSANNLGSAQDKLAPSSSFSPTVDALTDRVMPAFQFVSFVGGNLTINANNSGVDDVLAFQLVGNDIHAKLGAGFVDTGADNAGANQLNKLVVNASAAIGATSIDLSGLNLGFGIPFFLSNGTITTGSGFADSVVGTMGKDTVFGGKGNDTVFAAMGTTRFLSRRARSVKPTAMTRWLAASGTTPFLANLATTSSMEVMEPI